MPVSMSNLKNAIEMERIELFENYINNNLSKVQQSEFDERLKSDEEFAFEFKIYLMTVDGICRESHQDNLDFGLAMKHISKAQLREIIGRQNVSRIEIDPAVANIDTSKPKIVRLKPWIWQVASIAAVAIITFAMVLHIDKNSRYAVDNAIYACADTNASSVRAGGETIDITILNDKDLKERLPELRSHFKSASSEDEFADIGFTLAIAYLRLHDRNSAMEVLEQLVTRFNGNADYAESVSKWKSILVLLK